MESESEWSQHKKLIDITGKGLKKSVPPDFPYFCIQFSNGSGYAHVIEDERSFSRDFGRSVVGGMLRLPDEMWRKPHDDPPDISRQQVANFLKIWQPFDWTTQLDGGEY